LNLEFHGILAEASGNLVLTLFMRSVVELLERLDREYPTNRSVSRQAVEDHRHLIEALRLRDAGQAADMMTTHLQQLEGRFARIQRMMRQHRSLGEAVIPPWPGAAARDTSPHD
jgi:DNA-binding FadR family transcriptional regulator